MSKLKIEYWPIENLTPYELNAKKHEKDQVARIAEAITKADGFDVPIVVDKHGVIIKGHGRRLAALQLGMKTVPVIVRSDLNPEQVKAARLADNRAAISDLDPNKLREELASMEGFELLEGIFDAKELEFTVADLGTMNADAFVEDMGAVLEDQKASIDAKADAATGARVPLAKAFGFKDLAAAGQLIVSKFMAKAEAATGLKGDAAFVRFAEGLV